MIKKQGGGKNNLSTYADRQKISFLSGIWVKKKRKSSRRIYSHEPTLSARLDV